MPATVPTVEELQQVADRLTALSAAVGGINETLDRLNTFAADTAAYLADVEKRVRALEGTPPTLVGSSSGTLSWADLVSRVGKDLAVRRSYQPPKTFREGMSFAMSAAAVDTGKRASLFSFKGDTGDGFTDWPMIAAGLYDNRFRTFLASVPDDHELIVAFHHERDGGHGSSADGNPADAVAIDRRFYPMVVEANRSRRVPIRYAVIVMGYTVTNRDASVWFDPAACDVLGFDQYSPSGAPFADKVAPLVEYAKAAGLPALVAETGTPASLTRAKWIADAVGYARAAGLVAWCYWNQGTSTLTTGGEYAALGA